MRSRQAARMRHDIYTHTCIYTLYILPSQCASFIFHIIHIHFVHMHRRWKLGWQSNWSTYSRLYFIAAEGKHTGGARAHLSSLAIVDGLICFSLPLALTFASNPRRHSFATNLLALLIKWPSAHTTFCNTLQMGAFAIFWILKEVYKFQVYQNML